ncbi:UDP-N-acetylmuramate--L-alanine ligase [Patescibacteria group bacterium]
MILRNSENKTKKIHFIGIGGIGVSALAQYYLEKDHKISGSDLSSSEITKMLKKKGVKIFIGEQKAKNLAKDTNLVIFSPAVPGNNPELKKAKKLDIRYQSYPEALGELTKKYFTIAVSGTHGKSTTASMIGLLFVKAGLDPTVIIGTKLKEFQNSNCRVGKSKYLVIEADEHFASFLNYRPQIIILTNIEKDHLDYYKNLKNILKSFKKYISYLPSSGVLIANKDDINISKIKNLESKTVNYSIKQRESKEIKKILKVPGTHNVYNALAALTLARILKIPDKVSYKALSKYQGSWRRFETKQSIINSRQLIIINDYAHHPTEIKATLSATREKFGKKKIWTIFQPHQYQRTFYLFKDFIKAFKEADELVLTEIFDVAGREELDIKEKTSSKKLANEIKKSAGWRNKRVHFIKNFQNIPEFLKNKVKENEVIIIMGAGNIYKLYEEF